MNSRDHSDDLLDKRLQHTLKNWVASKETLPDNRDKLLTAAMQENLKPKSGDFIKRNLGWLFVSEMHLRDRSVLTGYGYALDTVYAIRVSMTVA